MFGSGLPIADGRCVRLVICVVLGRPDIMYNLTQFMWSAFTPWSGQKMFVELANMSINVRGWALVLVPWEHVVRLRWERLCGPRRDRLAACCSLSRTAPAPPPPSTPRLPVHAVTVRGPTGVGSGGSGP